MNTVFGLDPILYKKFPTICDEAQKIATALAVEEKGSRLEAGFLTYASGCSDLITSTTPLRKVNKELDAALQTLSQKVQAAYAKIAPSDFLSAIKSDDAEKAKRILKISDIQNKTLKNGEMPIHYAIRLGSLNVVKYLLNTARVNPLTKDHQGLTAFDHASIQKNPEMTAAVLGSALGTTIPVNALAALADRAELQMLGQELAFFRRPPVAKLPPLQAAAFLGDLQGLEKLSKEMDIHEADGTGMTPLHYAVLGGKEEIVRWLLAKGAKLDGKLVNGVNLLHLAAIKGSEAVLKLLLEKNAIDLNAVDSRGRTPLHFALASEQLTAARMLVERGGDPVIKTTMQTTPIAIFHYLSQTRADLRDPLQLDPSSLLILGSFAASAICQYFGKGDEKGTLTVAGKVLSVLPMFTTLFTTMQSRSLLALPANISFISALNGYLKNDKPTKLISEGAYTLLSGANLTNTLRTAWKNRALETYRPLRNVLVHTANTLFSAAEFLNTNKTLHYPYEFDCTGMTEKECIKHAGEKLVKFTCLKPDTCRHMGDGQNYDKTKIEPLARSILGVKEGHTLRECKKAYKNMSLQFHSDKVGKEFPTYINRASELICQ